MLGPFSGADERTSAGVQGGSQPTERKHIGHLRLFQMRPVCGAYSGVGKPTGRPERPKYVQDMSSHEPKRARCGTWLERFHSGGGQ